ncbi:MAG: acetate/propionate family kinase, partial [Candidatus Omnitrophica bacterium]|nr:acetate/propionate family kinase [Candidatus Omnitrophota bacterium]
KFTFDIEGNIHEDKKYGEGKSFSAQETEKILEIVNQAVEEYKQRYFLDKEGFENRYPGLFKFDHLALTEPMVAQRGVTEDGGVSMIVARRIPSYKQYAEGSNESKSSDERTRVLKVIQERLKAAGIPVQIEARGRTSININAKEVGGFLAIEDLMRRSSGQALNEVPDYVAAGKLKGIFVITSSDPKASHTRKYVDKNLPGFEIKSNLEDASKLVKTLIGPNHFTTAFNGALTPEEEEAAKKMVMATKEVVSEAGETLEKRKQMQILQKNGSVQQLEDIILAQDQYSDEKKDWGLLTEAVAALNQLGLSNNEYILNKYQTNLFWCPENQGRRDMHMHTALSDGRLDIEAVMKELVKHVVKVAAITDHFVLCGIDKYLELGKKYGIVIIPAVEFYCYKEADTLNHTGITGDIVAYFVNPNDEQLNTIVENSSRRFQLVLYSHALQMLDYLAQRGELDAALAQAPAYLGMSPDQIIRKLVLDQNNYYLDVYKRNGITSMIGRVQSGLAGMTDTDVEIFNALLRRIYQAQTPYILSAEEEKIMFNVMFFQTSEASLTTAPLWKGVLQKYIEGINDANKPKAFQWGWVNIANPNAPLIIDDAQALITAIHKAGGIAVFAHPRWYPDVVFPNGGFQADGYALIAQHVRELKEKEIDALEVYTHWLNAEKDEYYLSLAKELNLPVSYGTDCHYSGKENLALGIDGNFYMPYSALLTLQDKAQKIKELFVLSGKKALTLRDPISYNGFLTLEESRAADKMADVSCDSVKQMPVNFDAKLKAMLVRGILPVVVTDMDGTLTPSRAYCSDKIAEVVFDILKAGGDFIILTSSDFKAVKEQFLNKIQKMAISENKYLANLYIFVNQGTEYYKYNFKINEFELVFKVSIEKEIGERKVARIKELLSEAINNYELESVRGDFVEDRGSQITLFVIGKDATKDEKLEYYNKEQSGEVYNRQQIVNYLNERFSEEGIDVFAHAGGKSSIDINLSHTDKGCGIDRIVKDIGVPRSAIIYFGDEFRAGESDAKAAARVELTVNVGINSISAELSGKNIITAEKNGPDGTADYLYAIRDALIQGDRNAYSSEPADAEAAGLFAKGSITQLETRSTEAARHSLSIIEPINCYRGVAKKLNNHPIAYFSSLTPEEEEIFRLLSGISILTREEADVSAEAAGRDIVADPGYGSTKGVGSRTYPARLKEIVAEPTAEQLNNLKLYFGDNAVIFTDQTISGNVADTETVPGSISVVKGLASRAPPYDLNNPRSLDFQILIDDILRHETTELKAKSDKLACRASYGYFKTHQEELRRLLRSFREFKLAPDAEYFTKLNAIFICPVEKTFSKRKITAKSVFIKISTIILSIAIIGSAVWLGSIARWWEFNSEYLLVSLISYLRVFLLVSLALRFFSAFVLYKPYAPKDFYPDVSIIIPAYNEGEGIGLTIEKAVNAGYPLDKIEIIAINDGSKDNTLDVIRSTAAKYPELVKVISFDQNQGKLAGMVAGIKQARAEIIIFVDSDSYIDEGSVYQLVQPLVNHKIAAVSGRVRAQNAGGNILAAMQDVWYYIMFKEKSADSVFGTVGCAPGCFSAYRKEDVLAVLDDFASVKVTCGEDRTLTNLVLKNGKKVVYQSTATAATIVPEKAKQFLKQQIRWQRSWAYEGLFAARFMWKKNPCSAFLFYSSFIQPYLMPLLIIFSVVWEHFVIGSSMWVVVYGLCLLPAVLSLYYLHKEERPHFLHYLLFTYLEVLVLYPAAYYCFATRTRNIWGTRDKARQDLLKPSLLSRGKAAFDKFHDRVSKKLNQHALSKLFAGVFFRIGKVVFVTFILFPMLFSACSTFGPYVDSSLIYAQESSAYYSWHQEPENAVGSSQGWDLPAGWTVDERGYGVYPETQASLRIANSGTAVCGPVEIDPNDEFVLQFMLDVIRLDRGSIKVYIYEYAADGKELVLLNRNLYADFNVSDIAYVTEKYLPSSSQVDVVSISIEAEGTGGMEAYLDGVRLSRIDKNSQAYDFLMDPHVVFRFDDGWDSQVKAARILEEHDFKGVFNIIPGLLEGQDSRLNTEVSSSGYMSLADVRGLAKSGHEIGGHTINLQENTSSLTDAERFLQIVGCADLLRQSGVEVTTYAAPEFYFDARDQRAIFRYFPSYQKGPSDDLSDFEFPFNPYTISVLLIPSGTEMDEPVAAMENTIDLAIDNDITAVLLFHRFVESAPEYDSELLTEDFERVVDYVASLPAGTIDVVTFEQLLTAQEEALIDLPINFSFSTTQPGRFDSRVALPGFKGEYITLDKIVVVTVMGIGSVVVLVYLCKLIFDSCRLRRRRLGSNHTAASKEFNWQEYLSNGGSLNSTGYILEALEGCIKRINQVEDSKITLVAVGRYGSLATNTWMLGSDIDEMVIYSNGEVSAESKSLFISCMKKAGVAGFDSGYVLSDEAVEWKVSSKVNFVELAPDKVVIYENGSILQPAGCNSVSFKFGIKQKLFKIWQDELSEKEKKFIVRLHKIHVLALVEGERSCLSIAEKELEECSGLFARLQEEGLIQLIDKDYIMLNWAGEGKGCIRLVITNSTTEQDSQSYPATMPTSNGPDRSPVAEEFEVILAVFGGKDALAVKGIVLDDTNTVISPVLTAPAEVNNGILYINPNTLRGPPEQLKVIFQGHELCHLQGKDEKEARDLTVQYLIENGLLSSHLKFLEKNQIELLPEKDWLTKLQQLQDFLVLVFNCGSSSLKYRLINMKDESVVKKGTIGRIGESDGPATHFEAIQKILAELAELRLTPNAIGHRVVHGGDKFKESVLIDEKVKAMIKECIMVAPLHNPPNLMGIEVCEKLLPGIPQVAVFDTAFHYSLPPEAYLYAIPKKYYEELGIRKYGFHGTSYRYVANAAAEKLGISLNELNAVICHLGNGSSVAKIRGGKSVDTSMGFTPLEGLVMGTRSGDMDPAVIEYLANATGKNIEEITQMLNKKSGLLGLSGFSNDMMKLQEALGVKRFKLGEKPFTRKQQKEIQAEISKIEAWAAQDEDQAKKYCALALKVFTYRIASYVGRYYCGLPKVNAIIFTAGIGENEVVIRQMVINQLPGIPNIDRLVLVIPTDEELMIARDTKEIVDNIDNVSINPIAYNGSLTSEEEEMSRKFTETDKIENKKVSLSTISQARSAYTLASSGLPLRVAYLRDGMLMHEFELFLNPAF